MGNGETERIGEEIRKLFPDNKPFKPFAIYIERLDRILVVTKDCRKREINFGKIFGVCRGENHFLEYTWLNNWKKFSKS